MVLLECGRIFSRCGIVIGTYVIVCVSVYCEGGVFEGIWGLSLIPLDLAS